MARLPYIRTSIGRQRDPPGAVSDFDRARHFVCRCVDGDHRFAAACAQVGRLAVGGQNNLHGLILGACLADQNLSGFHVLYRIDDCQRAVVFIGHVGLFSIRKESDASWPGAHLDRLQHLTRLRIDDKDFPSFSEVT